MANATPHRRLRGDRSRSAANTGTHHSAHRPRDQERDGPARGARPMGRERALRSRQPRREESRQQALAGLARSQGQAAAGDDDRRAEGRLRAGSHRRPHRRIPRCARHGRGSGRSHRRHCPASTASGCWSSAGGSRPRAARASRCSSSASGWASRTSFRAWTRSTCATTARSRCWSASKAASTRSRSARARPRCWAGPRAIWPSRATIRRWAWRTCAPSCPRCKRQRRPRSKPTACATSL